MIDLTEEMVESDDLFEFAEDIISHPSLLIEKGNVFTWDQLKEGGLKINELNQYVKQGIVKNMQVDNPYREIKKVDGSSIRSREKTRQVYQEKGKLNFYVGNSDKREGKIQLKLTDLRKRIVLVEVYSLDSETSEDPVLNIRFVGQSRPLNKKFRLLEDLTIGFYIYSFISRGEQYLLLSQEDLHTGNCTVEGMIIDAKLDLAVLDEFKLSSKIPLYFPSSIHHKPRQFDKWEDFINHLKQSNGNYEKLMDYIGYHQTDNKIYRQHPLAELFDMAWLLSTPIDGYSPGRIRIGEPSTGKTKWVHAIHQKYNENQPIVDGSSSTIKGLVPSFKSSPPSTGAFLNSCRLVVVDEFFRMLTNSPDEEARRQILGKLNSLLDRVDICFTSGSGFVRGKMSGKFYATTNPVYGTHSLPKLLYWLDQAFLSRCIPEYLSSDIVEWVKSHNHERRGKPEWMPSYEWGEVVDCAEANQSMFDENIVRVLVRRMGDTTQEDLIRSFLRMRMDHHACCLLDGIVKVRCLKELSSVLVAGEADYRSLVCLLGYLGDNWSVVSGRSCSIVKFGEVLGQELDVLFGKTKCTETRLAGLSDEIACEQVAHMSEPLINDRGAVMTVVNGLLSNCVPFDEAEFLLNLSGCVKDSDGWLQKLMEEGVVYRPKPGLLLLL